MNGSHMTAPIDNWTYMLQSGMAKESLPGWAIPSEECRKFFGDDNLELQATSDGRIIFMVFGGDGFIRDGVYAICWQRRGAASGRDDFYVVQFETSGNILSETPYRMPNAQ